MKRPSTFETALQISEKTIQDFTDVDLKDFMRELLAAELQRMRGDLSKLNVGPEVKASDDGCDGYSPAPGVPSDWLGSTPTCWQFKAGQAGIQSRIAGEISKKIPAETLRNGGRFVLIASETTDGKKGRDNRVAVLVDEANSSGLPVDKIDVFTSDVLARWANEHPAVAAMFAGRPRGLRLLEQWSAIRFHNVPWQPTANHTAKIDDYRRLLEPNGGEVIHLHVRGHPGVGKTRFALELCRDAPWKREVVYVAQATDPEVRVQELLDCASSTETVRLVLVIDEVSDRKLLRNLHDSVTSAGGRIRLITIGTGSSHDPEAVREELISPLDVYTMEEVIRGWNDALPREHVEYAARFAAGYVRLAKLASEAIARRPNITLQTLLDIEHIRDFLTEILGNKDRAPLYVVAVQATVGWEGQRQHEGKLIADALGMDWLKVRDAVQTFDDDLDIVPQGGDYRYISPRPLAVYLAAEAWKRYRSQLIELEKKLSPDAREAFYRRLQDLASTPQAGSFAEEELQRFFSLGHFLEDGEAKRWRSLIPANPELAALRLRNALVGSTNVERQTLRGEARSELRWALSRLAWSSSTFYDATTCLAELAEAETENFSNNASGEFLSLFHLDLSGTAVPFLDRLRVVDDLLARPETSFRILAVRALGEAADTTPSRLHDSSPTVAPREPEWRPTGRDRVQAILHVMKRLEGLAGSADIADAVVEAAKRFHWFLRYRDLRSASMTLLETVIAKYPARQDDVQRTVREWLDGQRKYWKDLKPEELDALEKFYEKLRDPSVRGRILELVGPSRWDRDGPPTLDDLAVSIVKEPAPLFDLWSWLTSGKAGEAWLLGEELARADADGRLLDHMLARLDTGVDLRVIAGYLDVLAKAKGEDWLESVLDRVESANTDRPELVVDLVWRCALTARGADRIRRIVGERPVEPHKLAQLSYGGWAASVPRESLIALLEELSTREPYQSAALALLDRRVDEVDSDWAHLKHVAERLLTVEGFVKAGGMTSHHLGTIAKRLASTHTRVIAETIFKVHCGRGKDTWFIEHTEAERVLDHLVREDARAVWDALVPHLTDKRRAYRVRLGFPVGLVDRLPRDAVLAWVDEDPELRAGQVIPLARLDLADPGSLVRSLIDGYGDRDAVRNELFCALTTGSWSGSASEHWESLAKEVESVAKDSTSARLRLWASETLQSLRKMAEQDRKREAEADIGR